MDSLPLDNAPPLDNSSPLSRKSKSSSSSSFSKAPSPPIVDAPTIIETPLDASKDARQVVRLIQCPQCSYPLREPVTLPCGASICKRCIPKTHDRQNISYPAAVNRLQGFTCPFHNCQKEHAVGDCSIDVTLNKITEVVREQVERHRSTAEAAVVLYQVTVCDEWAVAGVSSLREEDKRVQVLHGGRLASTFVMAEMGYLPYGSETAYTPMSPGNERSDALDKELLNFLKETARTELDCQVCYGLFLEPLTTACGHTFCRKCVHRILDHSSICPICRRGLSIPPQTNAQQAPSNTVIEKILTGLCPEAMAERAMAAIEEAAGSSDMDTPLFVCTIAYPSMPTFLHIFEPRYRLMIRRAMESGNRKFGMVPPNYRREPQGELGVVPFCQYGTMLHITNMQLLPDGRSLIETFGISRFRVVRHGELDGYRIGKVERIDDIGIAAEEALEAAETSSFSMPRSLSAQDHFGAPTHPTVERSPPTAPDLDALPTAELMEIAIEFVKKMRETSASWFRERIIEAYGECPEDPALFPWWFASLLPMEDDFKLRLLGMTSVRGRLKLCVDWAIRWENTSWYAHFFGSVCS